MYDVNSDSPTRARVFNVTNRGRDVACHRRHRQGTDAAEARVAGYDRRVSPPTSRRPGRRDASRRWRLGRAARVSRALARVAKAHRSWASQADARKPALCQVEVDWPGRRAGARLPCPRGSGHDPSRSGCARHRDRRNAVCGVHDGPGSPCRAAVPRALGRVPSGSSPWSRCDARGDRGRRTAAPGRERAGRGPAGSVDLACPRLASRFSRGLPRAAASGRQGRHSTPVIGPRSRTAFGGLPGRPFCGS